MNTEEAKKLFEKLCNVWASGTIEEMRELYTPDVKADYFGAKNIGLAEMENRFHYMNEHQTEREFKTLDVICSGENKFAIRCNFKAKIDNKENLNSDIMGVYHLNDEGKITHVWCFAEIPVDYLAKD